MKKFERSYYKLRIVFSFTIISAIIIITLSRVSYNFVKNIYLEQIGDHAQETARLISSRIDDNFLQLLEIGPPSVTVRNYFTEVLSLGVGDAKEVILLNSNLEILFHPSNNFKYKIADARLLIYRAELGELELNKVLSTQPFKGDDLKWYLWAFKKIDKNIFIALKEDAGRLAKVEEFSYWSWIIGIGLIFIILLISKLLADSITKPVSKLVKFSLAIGNESREINIPEGMKGELKILGDAMGKMQRGLISNQKEKEKMLAQIAHEIRNPLGGIELLASLVKEDLNNDSKSQDYLEKILSEVNRLKFLITAFLDYSKPVKAVPEKVNLDEIKEYLKLNFNSRAKKKNIHLNFNFNTGTIFFDKEQLRQILVNLISNSLDAINENGSINISSGKTSSKYYLSISDDGPGINENEIENLFKPFFTTKKNGTGLGLAVCKKLAEENNADLLIKANNGFLVTLEKDFDE